MSEGKTLFCFGLGFTGQALARRLKDQGWRVLGTSRDKAGCNRLREAGYEAFVFTGYEPGAGIKEALAQATHVLNSVPPLEAGDPVLIHHGADLERALRDDLEWTGLLSTIGVYGEHHGGWVDETTPPDPVTKRARWRLRAEQDWQTLGDLTGRDIHVFRLPGIYGPRRNQLEKLRAGRARRLVKPGHVFNRVHVEDIALALAASIDRPEVGTLFNLVDDEPAPPQDVVCYGAQILGMTPPSEELFNEADLSPMARSFYGECKRVRNARLKQRLGVKLLYPTYREGLKALM